MNDDGLFCLKHAVQIWHRRIERKELIKLERRQLAIERERVVAAQREPIGIADRRYGCKSIQRAAEYDCEKTRIAAFGAGKLRQMRSGKQRPRGKQ
jgi:hypothetical protein